MVKQAKKKSKQTKEAASFLKELRDKNVNTFIGVDPGTNNTGLAVCIDGKCEIFTISIKPKDKLRTIEKFKVIMDEIDAATKDIKQAVVAIEKPFNVAGNAKVLLELFGVLRYNFHLKGYVILEVPQTSLKLFAAGKGNAQKSDMMLQAFKEFEIDGVSEDGVDAFWLARFAEEALLHKSKAEHRKRAMEKFLDE